MTINRWFFTLIILSLISLPANSQALTIPFVNTGSLITARGNHSATLLPDGKVLVVGGGGTNYTKLSSAEFYVPSNGTWKTTTSMGEPAYKARYNHTATLLADGRVLVAGGNDYFESYTTSTLLYTPSNETWKTTGSIGLGRMAHTATRLSNGKVLVVGGYNGSDSLRADLYDPSKGTWSMTGSLTTARRYHTATLLQDGRVLVTGGRGLSSSEIYDPSQGTWMATGSLTTNRWYHTATLLHDGRVLVAGGEDINEDELFGSEIYDPSTGIWKATGSMSVGRYRHTATLLQDGKVLVAGGAGFGFVSKTELYDPTNGTWTATGSIGTVRWWHTTTLLPDGRVLMAGGSNGVDGPLSRAELYGCRVSFDAAGGSGSCGTKTYYSGLDTYGVLPVPVRAGYIFNGWWTQPMGAGTHVLENTLLTANTGHTLYTSWAPDAFVIPPGSVVTPLGVTNAVQYSDEDSGDGGTSIRLGGIGLLGNGLTAGVEWTVSGPGFLSFDWKVSSEQGYDWLRFYAIGTGETNRISGTGGEWTRVFLAVDSPSNTAHTFRIEYTKDPVGDAVGDDCGWVDAITWTPKYSLSVTDGSGDGYYTNGTLVPISADAPSANHKFVRWTGETNGITDVFCPSTSLLMPQTNVSVAASYESMFHTLTIQHGVGSGVYLEGSKVSISANPDPMYLEFAGWTGDAAGFLTDTAVRTTTLTMPTRPASLTATYCDSVARVAGCYGRTFTVSGTAGGVAVDASAGPPSGTPAVKLGGAGVVPDNGFAAIDTVVSGSGSVSFWWRVSSESDADYLKFIVDGIQIASISGTKGAWTQVSNRVEGAGVNHTLRWEYDKNGSLASSIDSGWVDDIIWMGDIPSPVLPPEIRTVAFTNNVVAFTFFGERGIPYVIYSNATLNAAGWALMDIKPMQSGETNGVFLFDTLVLPPVGQKSGFYRVGM